MRVLSMFDGISCGRVALARLGITPEVYYASEIDKYAEQVSADNWPDIVRLGDAYGVENWNLGPIDLLLGGSPCTYWSIARKDNRETESSGIGWELFSLYVKALEKFKPRYFLYENVKSMSNTIREEITRALGVEPILINSALVSAQNRNRLYWTNIPGIEQPADRGIFLRDILETGLPLREKGFAVKANYGRGYQVEQLLDADHFPQNGAAEPVIFQVGHGKNAGGPKYGKAPTVTGPGRYESNNFVIEPAEANGAAWRGRDGISQYEVRTDGKSNAITATGHQSRLLTICVNSKSGRGGIDGLQPSLSDRIYDISGKAPAVSTGFVPKTAIPEELAPEGVKNLCRIERGKTIVRGKPYKIDLPDGFYILRKLTVTECCRLQTLPDNYCKAVSPTQAYKTIGNGWTVETIAHILKYMEGQI